MRVLVLSKTGDGLGIAHRIALEGHEVDVWIQDPRYKRAGVGLVGRPPSWRPLVAKADLVICDTVGFGHYEATLRRIGKQPLACNLVVEQAELNRAKGMELFEKVGIPTPPTRSFSSPRDATSAWSDKGVVVKPSGNISTAKTTVARDRASFLWALESLPPNTPVIVQELVEGIEVSTEGWWNGRSWIRPWNHTFEEKRFLNGGIGPNTGCMGNVVVVAKTKDRLVQETVGRLEPFLKRTSYRGPVDVNAIVNKDKVWALEITARFGYDAIEALAEGLDEPLTDVLFETAMGVKKEMRIDSRPMIAVRVSVPPYPHADPKEEDAGRPLLGVNKFTLKHIFLTDVYLEGGQYKWAAGDGVVYKATAIGEDFREARRRVYRTISNVTIQDMQYRTDIGKRVDPEMGKEFDTLREWGWLN